MLRLKPFSSESAFSASYLFRCISLLPDLSPQLLRGICFAAGIWFAWASISAELMMAEVFSGRYYPVPYLLTQADRAVSRYPFDPSLRGARDYVRQKIMSQEAPDVRQETAP